MNNILFFMLITLGFFSTVNSQDIVGTWDRQGNIQGFSWKMEIKSDGTYETYANNNSVVEGVYWTSQDTLTYHDVFGQFSCDTTIIGIALFTVTANQLTIEIIIDGCSNRNQVMEAVWIRQPVNVSESNSMFSKYFLDQNYPNPFNPITKIRFSIPSAGNVILKIYDIFGREVKTLISDYKQTGTYEVSFDGRGLASGIYFYQLKSDTFLETKKMILIK